MGYGKYKAPYFPHAEMEAFLADDVLKNTSFVSGDFAGVIEAAGEGDVIFAIRRMNRCRIQKDLPVIQEIASVSTNRNGWYLYWWKPTSAALR